ncbi:hypothetical protein ACFYO2_11825 [Streptomyces sp. NPDC006602]|uniref:hypothetical protein n=1 Tax=Streptomyces sp. NPDC006602 TaxID=3364751 RepID=UPI0036C582E9
MSRITRKVVVGLIAACGALGAAVAPATAADYAPDEFIVLGEPNGHTKGAITWYNRTANIQGYVLDISDGGRSTRAIFEAFAGSTKIDSETRTTNNESDLGSKRSFNFTIGDTDLADGIDRIKITVCQQPPASGDGCSSPENYSKD